MTRRPTLIRTILGSCVGVTFWSARAATGALCHCVLPSCPATVTASERYRYVDSAIRYLAHRFDRLGIMRREVEVKVFGGADVLPTTPRPNRPTVGAMNCERAMQVLAEEGFIVAAKDMGGTRGRTIQFHSGTGEVWSKRLDRLAEH